MPPSCPCAKTARGETAGASREDPCRPTNSTDRATAQDARGVAARWRTRPDRAPACLGQADRARAPRPAARPGLVRRARRVRHPPGDASSASTSQRFLGDGVVTGHGHDRRPARLRLPPGLHGLRRIAVRGVRREDLQGHGPGDEGRRADRRPQRFRRGADPGGRRRRSAAMPTSSCATRSPRASSRSSR